MVAARSTRTGFFLSFFGRGRKTSKPNSKGNTLAFKAGARSFKATNGATPELQRVMMMSLQNAERLKETGG